MPDDFPVLEPTCFEEFGCLNLSLSIPAKALAVGAKKIPVLVFIHGGAYVNGSHAIQLSGREVFDGTGVVRHSISLKKDILVVGINYRVGPLGFLASRDISELNAKHKEDIGNYGLHDQRRALEWLNCFVAGFGGDPDNITIQGTSAGASSCHFQSMFPKRKFVRAIYASGTATGVGARDMSYHQEVYDNLVNTVASDVPRDKALEKLSLCNVKDLTHKVTWIICYPLIENKYIPQSNYSGLAHDEDLPDVMVGVADYEAELSMFLFTNLATKKPKTDSEIVQQINSTILFNHSFDFPTSNALTYPDFQPILKAYHLEENLTSPSTHLDNFCHLLGNIMFDVPSLYLALSYQKSRSKGRVWLYYYSITNQYPASHAYGRAHHGVNDLLLFNSAPDMIPREDRESWDKSVAQTQRSWIEFVNGDEPWCAVRRDASVRDVLGMGPIYKFEDQGKSSEFGKLKDCVGEELARQYDSLLQASRLVD